MSVTHLVVAGCGLVDRMQRPEHLALCGASMSASHVCRTPDCDGDRPVCEECVIEAGRAVGRWIRS